ncbi:MAG: hypothetical protein WC205_13035 [Opitutaceae bacterium]|jgi:Tfp pilus assembly protein PilV
MAGRPRSRDGFALLITITLLAFLVLLLVSLASLTRVETQVAANSQQVSQARQNALLALNMAIGQLQKYAGPDQRVTARAEILPATTPAVTGGTMWTGVWGNSQLAIATSSTATSPMNWLVSGNEKAAFTAAAATGQITAIDTAPTYLPTQAVSGLTVTSSATSTDIKMSDGTEARLMVGSGSAGATVGSYVVAPLEKIDATGIPGLAASDTKTIGRYAWWVGDEGVKAKVNRVDVWSNAASGETAAEADARKRLRYMVAQRDATERLTGFSTYDPATVADIDKALNAVQLPMLAAPAAITTALVQDRYHDLTTASMGVLSDTLRGGLKKDLTAAFAPGTTAASSPTGPVWTVATPPSGSSWVANMNTTNGYDGKGVSWQLLRSYYQLSSRLSGSGSSASISPVVQDVAGDRHGVVPVVAFYQFFFTSKLVESPAGSGTFVLQLRHVPAIVLWNPYNVTINDATYTFSYDFDGRAVNVFTRVSKTTASPATADPAITGAQAASPYFTTSSADAMQFSLSSGVMAPGASYVYTLPGDVAYTGNNAANYVLTQGWGAGAANANGILVESAPFTLPALPSTESYTARLWIGRSSTTPSESTSVGVLDFPGTDKLIMKLGSSDMAQAIGGNNASLGVTAASPCPTLNIGANPSGSISVGWIGLEFGLKATALPSSGKLPGFSTQASSRLIRWFADANVRAPVSGRSAYEFQNSGASGYFGAHPNFASRRVTGTGDAAVYTYYPVNDGTALPPFGFDYENTAPVVLFDVPRAGTRVASIGALQHVNAYRLLDNATAPNFWRIADNFYPGYPIGNSQAVQRVGLAGVVSNLTRDNVITGSTVPAVFFDHSYLYNRALWDGYFFSTVPDAATATTPVSFPLPNSRHLGYGLTQPTLLRDTDQAATELMVDGSFNINSTSVEAWTALLASTNNVPVGSTSRTDEAPYPRLVYPINDTNVMTASSSASSQPNSYQGYRFLTKTQIAALAAAIVTEVKNRGPFVSLADFVNRSLVDNPATAFDERLMGALARALDVANVNSAFVGGTNPAATMASPGGSYNAMPGQTISDGTPVAAGAPGWVTQADLLQALGPVLSARSDTFTVRAYGEVTNPLLTATDANYIQGRAWCEAVVQRLPDYVNAAATSSAAGDPAATGLASLQNTDNQKFGRRFKIISFRWLSPSDI